MVDDDLTRQGFSAVLSLLAGGERNPQVLRAADNLVHRMSGSIASLPRTDRLRLSRLLHDSGYHSATTYGQVSKALERWLAERM